MSFKKSAKKNGGFTLIELVIGITLLVLVWFVMTNFVINIFSFNTTIRDDIRAQNESNIAFKTMAPEIRSMAPSSTGTYPLNTVATSTLIFFDDVYHNGLMEQVHYFISGTTLKKGVIIPTGNPLSYNSANENFSEVVHDVVNSTSTPIFDYFDGNYSGTSSPLTLPANIAVIRLIRVTLVIDHNPNKSPNQQIFTTQITMRNLKDNL